MVERHQSQLRQLSSLSNRTYLTSKRIIGSEAYGVANIKQRFQSSYVGSLGRRARETNESSNAAYHRNDQEAVIRLFESQPSLLSNPEAVSAYVKALVKADKLDESELLRTLQRGISGSASSHVEEENLGALSAFRNVGKATKDGVLGTRNTPIHMVAVEGGNFKEQLWRTFRSLAVAFLLISGIGALIEDRGISKGLGLNEEVQPSMETHTKFSDVKGVDEAKSELEEIVHYLRDPKDWSSSFTTVFSLALFQHPSENIPRIEMCENTFHQLLIISTVCSVGAKILWIEGEVRGL